VQTISEHYRSPVFWKSDCPIKKLGCQCNVYDAIAIIITQTLIMHNSVNLRFKMYAVATHIWIKFRINSSCISKPLNRDNKENKFDYLQRQEWMMSIKCRHNSTSISVENTCRSYSIREKLVWKRPVFFLVTKSSQEKCSIHPASKTSCILENLFTFCGDNRVGLFHSYPSQ